MEENVSPNLVAALRFAKSVGARILGMVRDGGYTAQAADVCVIIPTVNPAHTTPHAEAFKAIVWHLSISHPNLKQAQTKWESVWGPEIWPASGYSPVWPDVKEVWEKRRICFTGVAKNMSAKGPFRPLREPSGGFVGEIASLHSLVPGLRW